MPNTVKKHPKRLRNIKPLSMVLVKFEGCSPSWLLVTEVDNKNTAFTYRVLASCIRTGYVAWVDHTRILQVIPDKIVSKLLTDEADRRAIVFEGIKCQAGSYKQAMSRLEVRKSLKGLSNPISEEKNGTKK